MIGGPGGRVFLRADKSCQSLNYGTSHFNAENGTHGGSSGMTGRSGKDLIIRVPIGTTVSDLGTVRDPSVDDDEDDMESENSVDLDEHVIFRMA